MKFKEILAQVISAMVTFGGIVGTMEALSSHWFQPAEFVMALIFTGLGSGGFYLSRKKALNRILKDRQMKILRLFTNTGDQFSLAELALELDLSIEDTRKLMDSLHAKGVFDISTTENGAVVYSLPQSTNSQYLTGNYDTGDTW